MPAQSRQLDNGTMTDEQLNAAITHQVVPVLDTEQHSTSCHPAVKYDSGAKVQPSLINIY